MYLRSGEAQGILMITLRMLLKKWVLLKARFVLIVLNKKALMKLRGLVCYALNRVRKVREVFYRAFKKFNSLS